jgi:cytoskeletal protein RodZ
VFEIGTTLREARVRRKLTLQQAEEDTKVRVKYIQAMENEDFDVMPSPAYVKGFLRTYAIYLALDADVILQEYTSRFEPNEDHEPFGGNSALGHPRSHTRRNTLAFVAVVCTLVLVLVYVLGLQTKPDAPPPVPPSPSPSVSHSVSASPSPKPSPSVATFTLNVIADRGACVVSVYRESVDTKPVYTKTVYVGQDSGRLGPYKGPLFVTLDVPSNVAVRVNGELIARPTATTATTYRVTAKGLVQP